MGAGRVGAGAAGDADDGGRSGIDGRGAFTVGAAKAGAGVDETGDVVSETGAGVPGPAFCTGALSVCGGRDVLIGGRIGRPQRHARNGALFFYRRLSSGLLLTSFLRVSRRFRMRSGCRRGSFHLGGRLFKSGRGRLLFHHAGFGHSVVSYAGRGAISMRPIGFFRGAFICKRGVCKRRAVERIVARKGTAAHEEIA